MPCIHHTWYNCTAVHSQKLPIIYARCLVPGGGECAVFIQTLTKYITVTFYNQVAKPGLHGSTRPQNICSWFYTAPGPPSPSLRYIGGKVPLKKLGPFESLRLRH